MGQFTRADSDHAHNKRLRNYRSEKDICSVRFESHGMRPRTAFDIALVALLAASLSVASSGITFSAGLFWVAVDAVLSIDITLYLIVAGVFGTLYVGYIAIYLPQKQSGNRPR